MLRLSKKLDYALIILAHLAMEKPNGIVSARKIADSYGLPLPVTSGILKTLAGKKIVHSTRGVHGGHRLIVEPSRLTFGAIADAIEGPMQLADCVIHKDKETGNFHRDECEYESCCPVQKPVREIHQAISEILSSITLSQLMGSEPLYWQSQNPFERRASAEAVV